jgi:GT2 family glycosyltransferase
MRGQTVLHPPPVADPPADRILVVHATVPASGAPAPRDRQVLRRVLALAASANAEVVLVAAEPQIGSVESPELDDAGVRWRDATGQLHDVLADEAGRGSFVIATETWLGAIAMRAAPKSRLVLDLHHLDSTALERCAAGATPWYLDGFDHLLDVARDHEATVLRHAALTICAHDSLADAVQLLAPGAPTLVSAPIVPDHDPAPTGPADRRGVLFVGAFASEPGAPDEAALEQLVASLDAPVAAVGVDVSLVRRAIAGVLRAVHAPRELDRVVRSARVVVTARGGSAETAELRAAATPVASLDEPDACGRILALLRDDTSWRAASGAQAGAAAARRGAGHGGSDVLAALSALGAPVDPQRLPRAPATLPQSCPPVLGGTLAAVTVAGEAARAVTQPAPVLPWTQARFANLDLRAPEAYRRWLSVHHDVEARRDVLVARARRLADGPTISVIMPVHDTEPSVLRAAILSVTAQIYGRWQLCIADDGSTRADTRTTLAELAGASPQIVVTRLDEAGGIAAATNAALALANGAYVAFLDHDDVLTPDALLLVAERIVAEPDLDVLYSDEDKLDRSGRRTEPFCKPDWSPDLLLSCNYVTHLLVARRSLVEEAGGLRAGFDGAQDYDLVLRLTERTDRIAHVAAPLYSWRMSATSTAADIQNKPEAHAASRRAVQDAIVRRGIDATVEPAFDPTWHRVRRRIDHRPLVTVVIPTRDRLDLLAPCVDRLRATVDHAPLEILVVDNDSRDPATLDYLAGLEGPHGRVVRYPHRFNYARQMNLAAREARGDVLLLLNNDVRPLDHDWFDAMLEHALRPEVGAVGARLRFPSGRVQHEGIVLNACAFAANLDSGPWSVLGENIRNVSAVTAACVMIRTSVWHAVGGMDERLGVAWNDVDLCLRIGERGWRVIYTPYGRLEHAEGSSRGSGHPPPDDEFYEHRWGSERSTADPFFTTAIETLVPFSPRL